MTRKLLVVGLDGLTFDLIGPWMVQGRLPVLKELVDRGASGKLTTIVPPVTGPAWTSFMTGKNPGQHGVFDFHLKVEGSFDDIPVNASLRDGKAVWNILGNAGKKVVVLNVPVTYPPSPVNGCLVGDFMTPRGKRDFVYPAELLRELEDELGPYRLYLNVPYSPGRAGVLLDELFEVLDYKFRVANYLATRREWDFFMLHILGTDRIQHELYHVLDPTHHAHREDEARECGGRILEYFGRLDTELGRLIEVAGPDTTVMLMSDHGSGPIYRFMSFNVWLLNEGFLVLKRDPLTLLKTALYRAGITPELGARVAMRLGYGSVRVKMDLEERARLLDLIDAVFLSFDNVDWARTRAYSKGNYGQIFVNLKGREPLGSVEPGSEYEQVREAIVRRLRKIHDPATGETIIGPVWLAEDLYHGRYLRNAPDISFLPRDMSYKALGTLAFISNKFIRPSYGLSGDHRMDGVLICAGEGIRRGFIVEGANIVDLAPTILYLMGVSVPQDMDGRVVGEMIEESYRQRHPVTFADTTAENDVLAEPYSPQDAQDVIARLQALGYWG